jgi:hypothetical protein
MVNHPTVYLDTSTFGDAFDAIYARKPKGDNPYENLYILIGKISAEASLCYSTTHIEELLELDPYEHSLAEAEWIDSLHPVWVRSAERALDGELEWWLRRELGLPVAMDYCPFSVSFTGVIGTPTLSVATGLLVNPPTVAGIVRQCHDRREEFPDVKGTMVHGFQQLHENRSSLPSGVSAEDVARNVRLKIARDIETCARDLWPNLVGERIGLSEKEIITAARAIAISQEAVPLSRLWNRVMENICDVITEQEPTSKHFVRRYASAGHDLTHLTGGVYCDIFTCDRRVDEAIGSFRTDRGMLPQLSVRGAGGPARFVQQLETQVNMATRALLG